MNAADDTFAHQTTDHLIALWRAFGAFEKQAVCCGTVTVAQCMVLQLLQEGEARVSTLASATGSSASAMTRLVEGLVKKGWASRRRDEADRRVTYVALTDDGAAEADRLRALTVAGVATLLGHIPHEERANVARALGHVVTALRSVPGMGLGCC